MRRRTFIAALSGSALAGSNRGLARLPAPASTVLSVDTRAPGQPLDHFWSRVVGSGRANTALRATWHEELETAAEYCGFRYVRFHGIFHDDMFVYREKPDGTPVYNFQYVDDVFDRLLDKGVRPFVELGFSPSQLATVKDTIFWWRANGSPPNDLAKWSGLVAALVEHCIARYGADEVRQWYFEVWNEPNLAKPFFRGGTQEDYFDLYKATATAIKRIDSRLRVGGPATSNYQLDQDAIARMKAAGERIDPMTLPWKPVWVEDFLSYCAANHLPIDFVSTHPYPTDFPLDAPGALKQERLRRSVNATRDDLRTIRRLIDASPYKHAEIQLTEWSTSTAILDYSHDSLAAAAAIIKMNLDSVGLVDSLSYWTFSDVFEEYRETDSIFHGGFGMINYQQIVKPSFHAYRLLNGLGDQVLDRRDGAIVTRHGDDGAIVALAYNYPADMKTALPIVHALEEMNRIDASGASRDLAITLAGLPAGAHVELETLDLTHGNVLLAWQRMGSPDPPSRAQTRQLRVAAWATKKETIAAGTDGVLAWRATLDPWTVVLLRELT